jgi:hypothetical protein
MVGTNVQQLTEAGLAALHHFAELECWGSFSNSSMIKNFRPACKAAAQARGRGVQSVSEGAGMAGSRGWQYEAEQQKDRVNIECARSSAG